MKNIKIVSAVIVMLLCSLNILAQKDTIGTADTITQPKKKVRNGIGFIPNSRTKKINGLAIGAVLSSYDTITINGLNVEILGGFVGSQNFIDKKTNFKDTTGNNKGFYKKYVQQINGITIATIAGVNNAQINGITLSSFYNLANEVNGISAAFLSNGNLFFNGVELAIFANQASRGRGLQIGLFNTCYDLRGIQIGLWNKNGKRSLPFINWQFAP